ncbi:unnamed protein product, partial [Amoebophrya sp. A25]|eukprot:GSA25T00005644001.1
MQDMLFRLNQENPFMTANEPEEVLLGTRATRTVFSTPTGEVEDALPFLFTTEDTLKGVDAKNFSPVNADGDAETDDEEVISRFRLPRCGNCGADMLRPDVVYFGDKVPQAKLKQLSRWMEEAEGLVTFGTSLAVGSAWRIIRRCAERKLPIVVVNQGPTRLDSEFASPTTPTAPRINKTERDLEDSSLKLKKSKNMNLVPRVPRMNLETSVSPTVEPETRKAVKHRVDAGISEVLDLTVKKLEIGILRCNVEDKHDITQL